LDVWFQISILKQLGLATDVFKRLHVDLLTFNGLMKLLQEFTNAYII